MANQFDIRDALRFERTPKGLTRAVISTREAEAEVFLQGAHVAQWTPRGKRPVLYLSPKSLFEPGKAIRGGVPIIFPWFGPRSDGKPGPPHGFARTTEWMIEGTKLCDDASVEITLVLTPNEVTRSFGFDDFHVRARIRVGRELGFGLEVRNGGLQPLIFEEALHSYFAIADIHQTSVTGLEGTTYIDKTEGFKRKTLSGEALRIEKETDQVHLDVKGACVIHDSVWNRRIIIEKTGSDTTVVWNPWVEKSREMSDMSANGWAEMICVETANAADDAIHLSPGATHKLTASIHVEELG
ncbi:MAG: D-hexose-6-phosphate mutarotase [Bryobacterales bacterium]|nr:D-hexose-6-phosphate mutarotase [Bryobacterales bacterium]